LVTPTIVALPDSDCATAGVTHPVRRISKATHVTSRELARNICELLVEKRDTDAAEFRLHA
jgi:hypothetical protein